MKASEWVKGNEGLIIKGVLLFGGYFLVVHPLLTKLGVYSSKEDREKARIDEQNATGSGPFNPNYYKTVAGAMLLPKAVADQYASIIYEADDAFDDDEQDVFGVFRQLKAKTQVSWLADRFFALYQRDLYGYLKSFLDDSEMDIVNGIVNKLL